MPMFMKVRNVLSLEEIVPAVNKDKKGWCRRNCLTFLEDLNVECEVFFHAEEICPAWEACKKKVANIETCECAWKQFIKNENFRAFGYADINTSMRCDGYPRCNHLPECYTDGYDPQVCRDNCPFRGTYAYTRDSGDEQIQESEVRIKRLTKLYE
jgi:hypothetical protein